MLLNLDQLIININETAKVSSSETMSIIRDEMDALQFKHLGSGCFGSVYEHLHDDNKVVKVCGTSDGYYMFAKWCMLPENANNPHLPKIYQFKTIKVQRLRDSNNHNNETIFVIVMEKLVVPLKMSEKQNRNVPRTSTHFPDQSCGMVWRTIRDITSDNNRYAQFTNNIPNRLTFKKEILKLSKQFAKEEKTSPLSIKQMQRHSLLINTCYTIFSSFSKIARLDFHNENIMLRKSDNFKRRGTGTLIITDPISGFHNQFLQDINNEVYSYNNSCYITNVVSDYKIDANINIVSYGKTDIAYTFNINTMHNITINSLYQA